MPKGKTNPKNRKARNVEGETNEDIQKLRDISSEIEKLLALDSFSDAAISIFVKIGQLAAGIHFNDEDEGCKDYIRNKFSSIDRTNDATRRNGGLELMHLAALATIFDPDNVTKTIVAVVFKDLLEDFKTLKKKIALVLVAVDKVPQRTYEEVLIEFKKFGEAKIIVDFVSYYYVAEITKELLNVIRDKNLHDLDFSKREDRYYFGRVLSIVGELCKELKDFVAPREESGLFSLFKKIRDIRLAHSHSVMIHDVGHEKIPYFVLLRKLLISNMGETVNELFKKIESFSDKDEMKMCEKIEKFKLKLGKLSDPCKKELKKLIESVFGKNEVEVDEVVLFQTDPPEQEVAAKKSTENSAVAKSASSITDIFSLLKILTVKSKLYRKYEADKNTKKVKQLAEIKSEIKAMIVEYNAVVDSGDLKFPDENAVPALELIEKFKERYGQDPAIVVAIGTKLKERAQQKKEEGAKKSASDKDTKENSEKTKTKKSEQVEPEQVDPEDIKEKVNKKLTIIFKEFTYLEQVLRDSKMVTGKQQYVAEFCLSKIGQGFKDLEAGENSLLATLAPNKFHESVTATTVARHKLMHSIMVRKKLPFSKLLVRQALPLMPELKAFNQILGSADNAVQTSDIGLIFKVGRAYAVLKQYGKAFECFETMLATLETRAQQINKNSTTKELIEDNANVLNAIYGLAEACGMAASDALDRKSKDEHDDFCRLKILYLEEYLAYIENVIRDDLINPYIIPVQIASAYNNLGNTYSDVGNYGSALDCHKKAFVIIKKRHDTRPEKIALYLFNTAATRFHQLKDKAYSVDDDYIKRSNIKSDMSLVVACLWEAKEIYEHAHVEKISLEYIRVIVHLIEALCWTRSHLNLLYSSELYDQLVKLVEQYSVREDAQEILKMQELQELVSIANKIIKDKGADNNLLKAEFENSRNRVDVQFKIERLNYLRMFYMDIGLPDDLAEKLSQAQKQLSDLSQSVSVSRRAKFYSEVGTLINKASVDFRNNHFQQALQQYLHALTILNQSYDDYIPDVIGDLFENLGDAYSALNQPDQALKSFEDSLDAHIKYSPNDRAFVLPKKICELNNNLYEDCIERNGAMLKKAFVGFRQKVGDNDPRLGFIKKLLETFGTLKQDETVLQSIGPSSLTQQEKFFLETALKDSRDQQEKIFQTIEQLILLKYEEILRKRVGKLAATDLEISIKGVFEKKDLEEYLKKHLQLGSSSLSHDARSRVFSISLDQRAMSLLNGKIQARKEQSAPQASSSFGLFK